MESEDKTLREESIYDEIEGKMINKVTFQNEDVLKANQEARLQQSEITPYKGNLVKVASLHMGDVIRLNNMGYDLLSADPDEARRCLLYIQSNEPHLLTVNGRPFAKHRNKWA